MWGVVATAILVLLRRRLGLRHSVWRLIHNGLAAIVVVATVIHALQIEGAMEPGSKWMLCLAVVTATGVALLDLRVVRPILKRRDRSAKRGAERASPKPGVGRQATSTNGDSFNSSSRV
jgi:DMSO/TMAO reductase YedYZ heme-binding membrane subunit